MTTQKKLYRSCKDRVLGGVAGGIGEYFEIDSTLVRLLIALSFLSGFGFVAYILAWLIIPQDPSCKDSKSGAEEIKEQAEKVASDIETAVKSEKKDYKGSAESLRFWIGLTLVFFAVSLLLQNIFGFELWHNFWPIILVAIGVVLIAGSYKKE
jgi:phage shock protein C